MIFFAWDSSILEIDCVELPLVIVDSAAVATTFTRAVAATADPTVASTGLNARNLLGKLVLWYLEYNGCEAVSRL